MDTILIEVFLPTTGDRFEVSVPRAMNSLLAANLTAKALAPFSGNTYQPSHSSFFAWKEDGKALNMLESMERSGVINGSQLLLI